MFIFFSLGISISNGLISCHSSVGSLRVLYLASRPSYNFNQVPLINSQFPGDFENFRKNTIHQFMLPFNSLVLLLLLYTINIATGQLMSILIYFFKTDFYCQAFNPWMTINFWLQIIFFLLFLDFYPPFGSSRLDTLQSWVLSASPCDCLFQMFWTITPPTPSTPISVSALEPRSVKVNNTDNIDKQLYSAGKSLRLDRNHLPETTSQIKHPPHTKQNLCYEFGICSNF